MKKVFIGIYPLFYGKNVPFFPVFQGRKYKKKRFFCFFMDETLFFIGKQEVFSEKEKFLSCHPADKYVFSVSPEEPLFFPFPAVVLSPNFTKKTFFYLKKSFFEVK